MYRKVTIKVWIFYLKWFFLYPYKFVWKIKIKYVKGLLSLWHCLWIGREIFLRAPDITWLSTKDWLYRFRWLKLWYFIPETVFRVHACLYFISDLMKPFVKNLTQGQQPGPFFSNNLLFSSIYFYYVKIFIRLKKMLVQNNLPHSTHKRMWLEIEIYKSESDQMICKF